MKLKHVHQPPSDEDGTRVLVDRIWPRGLSKPAVSADLWLREAGPSRELCRWYGRDARRWRQFSRKYRNELERRPEVIALLDDLRRRAPVTLISGARDEKRSHAVVLRNVLEKT